jgi:hypothetical protein
VIAGTINDSLEPIVEIKLIRAGDRTAIPVVVDTGFSGDLCLSRDRIEAIDLEFIYDDRYELADGTIARVSDNLVFFSEQDCSTLDARQDFFSKKPNLSALKFWSRKEPRITRI